MKKKDLIGIFLPLAAFIAPLTLYIITLAPTYIPIDSAEFALCMKYWGVCHPPGFPLYILLGHIFAAVFPFGSLIYKANLLSAIFGAATILVVYLTFLELKVNRYLAFAVCILFAVCGVFWEFSIAADVFSFSTFLLALTFYAVFRKSFFASFFLLGLSASHFYISAVLGPVIYWFLRKELEESKRVRELESERVKEGTIGREFFMKLLPAGFLFALGFFPQIIMFWRMGDNPAVDWGHAKGISGFWYFVRRKEFGSIFLLSNPALTFSLIKLFKQFREYFISLLVSFGIVLPFFGLSGLLLGVDRRKIFLMLSFFILVIVQLTLLSTIDPTGADNPFQLNKFYLSSFLAAVLLIGLSLEAFNKKFLDGAVSYSLILIGFLTFIYLVSNFKTYNYSKNYFSQNMVNDAMGQLPTGSIAITVSHIVYFGGRYEQEVNGKFPGVSLLYFPNEKNRDNEFYKPELFAKNVDQRFVEKISRGKSMGDAERYVLATISRNLDHDIYILQGSFEEGFFRYLAPHIEPYGLWWKVRAEIGTKADSERLSALYSGLLNGGVRVNDLDLKQQRLDLATYAVSYHTYAVYLASVAKYDEAKAFFQKSSEVNPNAGNIANEIHLVDATEKLADDRENLVSNRDYAKISELGKNYYTLGNFEKCEAVFRFLVSAETGNANNFNNLASCQASVGKPVEAKENYKKALAIDPSMDFAKKGLEALGD